MESHNGAWVGGKVWLAGMGGGGTNKGVLGFYLRLGLGFETRSKYWDTLVVVLYFSKLHKLKMY